MLITSEIIHGTCQSLLIWVFEYGIVWLINFVQIRPKFDFFLQKKKEINKRPRVDLVPA